MTDVSLTPAALKPGGDLIGYARVSTKDQNLDRYLADLRAVGCVAIYTDKLSGKNMKRPGLIEAFERVGANDVLVVPQLDRAGRSLQDLIKIVGGLGEQGSGFRSLKEAIDTSTPQGRFQMHVFAALAEFIRELIVQGTNEGLDAAVERGVKLGRPATLTPERFAYARELLDRPDESIASIARILGVSRKTIYRALPELKPDHPAALGRTAQERRELKKGVAS
ncbi:recombinase family protein [Streptomyces sp. NPDC002851]